LLPSACVESRGLGVQYYTCARLFHGYFCYVTFSDFPLVLPLCGAYHYDLSSIWKNSYHRKPVVLLNAVDYGIYLYESTLRASPSPAGLRAPLIVSIVGPCRASVSNSVSRPVDEGGPALQENRLVLCVFNCFACFFSKHM
jgi:hypothetical protein